MIDEKIIWLKLLLILENYEDLPITILFLCSFRFVYNFEWKNGVQYVFMDGTRLEGN